MADLILASSSAARAALLENAGLAFRRVPADIDERAAEEPLAAGGAGPGDIAELLAEVKALDVSARHPGALVIGADQTLGLGEARFNKPEDMEAARRQLLALSGRTHTLHSAVCVARDGAILWRELAAAHMTMRPLSPAFVGQYLAAVGDRALKSVGCYQLEGPGIQLFERIDGDYFTILGLPLLPLLAFLRSEGAIAT